MALKLEGEDLETARELMGMAHVARPNGPLIKRKLEEYNERSTQTCPIKVKMEEMLNSGELVVVPAGFRCYTKQRLHKTIGLKQESFPFDVGFYSPQSLASLLKDPHVNLQNDEAQINHAVCMKYENFKHPKRGLGIRFVKSSYEEIDSFTKFKGGPKMNQYLDSSFGYYTLCLQHKFVLAHYNWHRFASPEKSKGICQPTRNIEIINETLNRRLRRMFEVCENAKYILFVFEESQGYNYIMIDDECYDLNDFSEVREVLNDTFSARTVVADLNDANSVEKVMGLLK